MKSFINCTMKNLLDEAHWLINYSQPYSCKVVSAFAESMDNEVKKLCKKELKPLIDRGILKAPGTKKAE